LLGSASVHKLITTLGDDGLAAPDPLSAPDCFAQQIHGRIVLQFENY
jgi:hypothetical protein